MSDSKGINNAVFVFIKVYDSYTELLHFKYQMWFIHA